MKALAIAAVVAVVAAVVAQCVLFPSRFVVSRSLRDAQRDGDAILNMFPISGRRNMSYGGHTFTDIPLPFHCFDATANIIVGSIDHAAATAMLRAAEDRIPPHARARHAPLHITKTADGKAIGLLWLMQYRETSMGVAYREVVFSIAAGPSTMPLPCSVEADAYCYLRTWANMRAGAAVYVARLWLDNDLAIALGRDMYGMQKTRATFDVRIDPVTNSVDHFYADGVLRATVRSGSSLVRMALGMLRHTGLGGLLDLVVQPYADFAVVGEPGVATVVPSDVVPRVLTRLAVDPWAASIHEWDPAAGDTLSVEHEELAAMRFTPAATIRDPNMRFVMLQPHN